MKHRQPWDLRKVLQVYNVVQILSCAAIIYALIKHGWMWKYHFLQCVPIEYSENEEAMVEPKIMWWIMMLKIVELLETCFFVLRKKDNQVSKLHLYHHTSTLMFCWLAIKLAPGGMTMALALINSFVHFFMYIYYFLAALGPQWQKVLNPHKPKLTTLQMIQFCIIIGHCCVALSPSCRFPGAAMNMLFIPNIILIFYMFGDFFKNNYLKKKNK